MADPVVAAVAADAAVLDAAAAKIPVVTAAGIAALKSDFAAVETDAGKAEVFAVNHRRLLIAAAVFAAGVIAAVGFLF